MSSTASICRATPITCSRPPILLDRMVQERTRELEQALEAVASSNRELNEAVVVGMTAQNRLRDAIDSISEGFAIFDPDDRLILCNQRFMDFWPNPGCDIRSGITFEELIHLRAEGRLDRRRRTDHGAEQWVADRPGSSAKHASSTAPTAGSMRCPTAAGSRSTTARRWKAASPRSTPTSPTSRMPSARNASARLAERSLHLQATLETMSIGVAVFDQDQRLVTANRRYGELLELPGLC